MLVLLAIIVLLDILWLLVIMFVRSNWQLAKLATNRCNLVPVLSCCLPHFYTLFLTSCFILLACPLIQTNELGWAHNSILNSESKIDHKWVQPGYRFILFSSPFLYFIPNFLLHPPFMSININQWTWMSS